MKHSEENSLLHQKRELNFSDLNKQKNCACSLEPEWTSHFFLHCHHYNTIQSILFKGLNSVDKNLFKLYDSELTWILLYGSTQYSPMNNHILLNSSIKYIENFKCYSGPLF